LNDQPEPTWTDIVGGTASVVILAAIILYIL
jgi:hypothetical protein